MFSARRPLSNRFWLSGKAAALGLLLALGTVKAGAADASWELRKQDDGIEVHTREVAGSQLKEFKVFATYPYSVSQIVDALRDVGSYMAWMPLMEEAILVSQTDTKQYHYIQNKAPWPVSNRDAVYEYVYSAKDGPAGKEVEVAVNLANHLVPEKKGIVRMPAGTGLWTIRPTAGGTFVQYQMHADPGGKIPDFLVNMGSVKAPFDTLAGLRKYLDSRYHGK